MPGRVMSKEEIEATIRGAIIDSMRDQSKFQRDMIDSLHEVRTSVAEMNMTIKNLAPLSETVALNQRIQGLEGRAADFEESLDKKVDAHEFRLTQRLVYGAVGIVLLSVLYAMLNGLTLHPPAH